MLKETKLFKMLKTFINYSYPRILFAFLILAIRTTATGSPNTSNGELCHLKLFTQFSDDPDLYVMYFIAVSATRSQYQTELKATKNLAEFKSRSPIVTIGWANLKTQKKLSSFISIIKENSEITPPPEFSTLANSLVDFLSDKNVNLALDTFSPSLKYTSLASSVLPSKEKKFEDPKPSLETKKIKGSLSLGFSIKLSPKPKIILDQTKISLDAEFLDFKEKSKNREANLIMNKCENINLFLDKLNEYKKKYKEKHGEDDSGYKGGEGKSKLTLIICLLIGLVIVVGLLGGGYWFYRKNAIKGKRRLN